MASCIRRQYGLGLRNGGKVGGFWGLGVIGFRGYIGFRGFRVPGLGVIGFGV